MTKTNAMRLLDQAKVPYELQTYPFDEVDLSGLHAAEALGMPPAQIFKTLVTRGERQGIQVFCIPVDANLDLKKAARVSGDKKITMLPLKELLGVTGYIRGGCSPIGMKKHYPAFLDASALAFDRIGISAGKRGAQLLLDPQALLTAAAMTPADLTEHE